MRGLVLSVLLVAAACEGPAGPAGTNGTNGTNGNDGAVGPKGDPGSAGSNGSDAISPWWTAPGLQLTITGLTFANGQATVAFTLADSKGVGIDRAGLLTDGSVSTSFVLSQLAVATDGTAGQYTAYTTRIQTTPDGSKSATQAATDTGGIYNTVDVTKGQYTYTFAASVAAYDSTKTQTVAGTATRTMNDGSTWISANDFSVGATPMVARQVITPAACNACHANLTAHGGHWTAVTQCVLCHQPQSSDPDTGNTVDFKVMIHKIHRGSSLPSVVAGGKYDIIGYQQSDNDFSSVIFPQLINRCETCHDQAATQKDNWKNNSTIETCTSCHDLTSFDATVPTGMVAHTGGPRSPDQCVICHAEGSIHPVSTRHHTVSLDPARPQLAVTIDSITNTAPGQAPTVNFTATLNGAPDNILTTPLPRLRVTFAGPNNDYASFWQATVQGAGAAGTLTALDAANGKFAYTVPASAAIPAAAKGSYTVGMEGYVQDAAANRYPTMNPVLAFAVTDATPVPRRQVVALDNCNKCHGTLNHHGPDGQGSRRDPMYCVMCHNANTTGTGTTRFEGSTPVESLSVDFKAMIHRIHMGERLNTPWSYVSGVAVATPGGTSTVTYATRYPRDQATCTACHINNSFQLPIPSPLIPTMNEELSCTEDPAADSNNYCDGAAWIVSAQNPVAAEASACTACHDAPYTAIHAQLNTTADFKTDCATCHGPGMVEDVKVVHHLP